MKTILQIVVPVCFVLAGVAVLAGNESFRVHAKTPACRVAVLRGGYGAGTTGLINSSSNANDITIPSFVPFAEAAYFLFDGHGNLSGSSSVTFGGIVSAVTFTGSYTVNANCTGSMTVETSDGDSVHRNLIIVDDGKEVEFVSTDPGVVIAGYLKKQHADGE